MKYPLLSDAFSAKDLQEGIDVIRSGYITMSKKTEEFEKIFAKKNNSNYAVMVNSGSSANLLAVAAACNPIRKKRLNPGDEVIIPSVCWSTSLWPLVQYNLKPVFVDIDVNNINLDIEKVIKAINKKTKAIMCVHILGMCTKMDKIIDIAKKNNLIIFEDTCESLGSEYQNKKLGNFGDFGTYSFYYSHQITSGEGGMIVCKNKEDYNLLKCLRSHGWSRNTSFHNFYVKKYPKIDNKFLFINQGYNLRPLDITAAIGLNQFKRLNEFIKKRKSNRLKIISSLKKNKRWNDQFDFFNPNHFNKPSWFGLPILMNRIFLKKRKKFLNYLNKNGIENRPILSGNFANQPSVKLFNLATKKNFFSADIIEKQGFFIGLPTKNLTNNKVNYLVNKLLDISNL